MSLGVKGDFCTIRTYYDILCNIVCIRDAVPCSKIITVIKIKMNI